MRGDPFSLFSECSVGFHFNVLPVFVRENKNPPRELCSCSRWERDQFPALKELPAASFGFPINKGERTLREMLCALAWPWEPDIPPVSVDSHIQVSQQ